MGLRSKTKRALERRNQKRARKAAQRARYAAWAVEGSNSKSKRFRRKSAETVMKPKGDGHNRCGNIGCSTCSPRYAAIRA